jgi:hypothetical protein
VSDADAPEAKLRAELAKAEAEIDAAYWRFTRQARAKPPSLVCPAAYRRRNEIRAELRRRRLTSS